MLELGFDIIIILFNLFLFLFTTIIILFTWFLFIHLVLIFSNQNIFVSVKEFIMLFILNFGCKAILEVEKLFVSDNIQIGTIDNCIITVSPALDWIDY